MQNRIDIGLVTNQESIRSICEKIAQDFGYSFQSWETVDKLFEAEQQPNFALMIVSTIGIKKEDAAGHIQVARQLFQDSFIVAIVSKTLDQESAAFIKKSGADVVVLEEEAVTSSKIDFICSQTLNSTYVPIKANEITPGVELTFNLYHLLPMRGKFLPCAMAGSSPDEAKIKKLSEVGEIYIHRSQALEFAKYAKEHSDMSSAGLSRRCRAQYLSLCASYIEFVYHITDKSEYSSFQKGQDLLKRCQEIAGALLGSLGGLPDAWQIVSSSAVGAFGSAERSPTIAVYAAIFGLKANMEKVNDIMIAALLSDLGLLYMDPKITRKIRANEYEKMTPQEREEYEKHSSISLDIALERKLPLTQDVRNIIVCTHESIDGKGFPRQLQGRKVPQEAELVHLCEQIDRMTLLRLGKQRVDGTAVRQSLLKAELEAGRFSTGLIARLI